jgi:hypothetical protein
MQIRAEVSVSSTPPERGYQPCTGGLFRRQTFPRHLREFLATGMLLPDDVRRPMELIAMAVNVSIPVLALGILNALEATEGKR